MLYLGYQKIKTTNQRNLSTTTKIRELVTAGGGLIRFLDVIPRGSIDDEKGKKETSTQLTVFDVLFHYCRIPVKDINKRFKFFFNDGSLSGGWNTGYKHKPFVVDLHRDDKVMQHFLIELFVRLRWQIIIACRNYIKIKKPKPTNKKRKPKKSQGIIWAEELDIKMSKVKTIHGLLKILDLHFKRKKGFKGPRLTALSLDTMLIETVMRDEVLNRYLLTSHGTNNNVKPQQYVESCAITPLFWRKNQHHREYSDEEARYFNKDKLISTITGLSQTAEKFGVELKIDADKSPDEQVYYWQYQQPTLDIEAKVAAMK